MVVAEVPMWVVHSSDNVASGGQPTNGTNSIALTQHGKADDRNEQRALESLKLLEGLGGTQKCAIYSVDMHPNGQKFATGGGDGTVRIWNAGALFAQSKTNNGKPTLNSKTRSSHYKEGGQYESSGESSAAEESHATTAADDVSGSESSLACDEEAVHDLSSLVRRKKDGSVNTPNQATASQEPPPSNAEPSSGKQQPHQQPPQPLQPPQHHPSHNPPPHRLLCTLSAHTGSSVLAVRFSTNGQYLASAGDDAVVCIYAPSSGNSATANGNLDTSVEHWTRIKLGRGHALDVVGLAWAPDDSHLVSCSLDSNAPIIVWKLTDLANSEHKPTQSNVLINPYKILGKGIHSSTVKGVTFDPAGTYLASSGDDPSVCVWRAHDDWGLEKRIDSSSGIFRKWSENDSHSLSSQSLFRRLSWSTDGAYICSTNAVVKNKHVASTISREGWAVSSAKSTASGAANLVGHKQPVVACRHCPFLLDARVEGENEDEDEPEYATLLALGDKRGFVTVWSTRRSRPVFKIQCSETRCTVTDLTWGRANKDIILIVSLLDGQVVVLKFGVPDELGNPLESTDQARVFQLRYGIDLNETDRGRRRLFVGENSGPKFIENTLQYTLEEEEDEQEEEENGLADMDDDANDGQENYRSLSSSDIKAAQSESRSKGGKKRIQPLLVSVDAPPTKASKTSNGTVSATDKPTKKKVDSLEGAMDQAEKAASGAEAAAAVAQQKPSSSPKEPSSLGRPSHGHKEVAPQSPQGHGVKLFDLLQTSTPQIPYSTDRIHSVELPVDVSIFESGTKFVADCTNSIQIPQGSRGSALPCTMISISRSGQNMYKDQIPGTSCSAIAACKNVLAIGTIDGCVQLYGTSPSLGWKSGVAFRSHPPFVFGRPIVALKLHENQPSTGQDDLSKTKLLVVSADGSFGVYMLDPVFKLSYKGSIMAPMSHMLLSSDMSIELQLPKLTRIQLTDTDRLLLILALHPTQGRPAQDDNRSLSKNDASVGAGGSMQGFVYDSVSDLWMRVADSRFVLSDFYSTLPSSSKRKGGASGELSKLDDSVRLGATSSTLKTSRRGRSFAGGHAEGVYQHSGDVGNDMPTRSHCEDRMACAIALNSGKEFEYWLSLYARTLAVNGNEASLRLLVDMLVGKGRRNDSFDDSFQSPCWWLSQAPTVLFLDRIELIKTHIIPEMSKNRALQRIMNEISVEISSWV